MDAADQRQFRAVAAHDQSPFQPAFPPSTSRLCAAFIALPPSCVVFRPRLVPSSRATLRKWVDPRVLRECSPVISQGVSAHKTFLMLGGVRGSADRGRSSQNAWRGEPAIRVVHRLRRNGRRQAAKPACHGSIWNSDASHIAQASKLPKRGRIFLKTAKRCSSAAS